MKLIKFILLCSLLLIGCSASNTTSFIGVVNNENFASFDDVDYTFSFSKLESKELLKIINENYYSHNRNVNVSKLIKNTDKLLLSCGLYDLFKNVSLIDGNLSLKNDTSLIEVFELNLFEIVNSLFEYNSKISIYLFSLYNPYYEKESTFYNAVDSLVDAFNSVIQNVCLQNELKYVDISFLDDYLISFNSFSNQGEKLLIELIRNI